MIKICLRQLRVLSRSSFPLYRFSLKKQQDESTSLVKKIEDVDKMVEYWDNKLSQVRPDSITVKQALNKIYLAETLMGTELQEKNWQFYEEVFDKNFIERVYIPKEFPQKIQIIFNIAMELSLLEYQYRLNRREFQKLEQALVRIKSILDNIYQYEKKKSDLGEAEFNHFLRQSQYFDMKAFYQKTLNPEGYVQFIEESTKCLDSAVKIVNDIIKHKGDEEQLKFQMGKSQALDKIARNFQLLAEFFLIAGQDEDARMFLEKAIEIYDVLYSGITPKSLICKCRIARSYMKDDQEKAIKLITELYDQIAQFGESDYLLLVKMYKFTIISQQQVDESEYEKVFELMQKYEVSDPFVLSELLFVSIKYTYKQNYHRALEQHLIQALMLFETTNDKKINLEQLLHLVGNVSIELPNKFHGQIQILKRVYENFEKWKNLIEDEYFWDHLTLLSLIKAKLHQLDGKSTEIILQPIINFINEAKQNDKQFLIHQNQISRFLKKNGLLQEQNMIEDLTQEDKELIVIVDEKNKVIGPSIRREMRLKNLIHRSTYIFVIQKQSNKFFVQKRSSAKRYCPSYFEPCFGGVVAFDETYDSNAEKEIQEEAGLKDLKLISDEEFYFENEASRAWGKIFYGYYDGDVTQLIPQPEEVEFIQLMSYEEIINSKEKWTPDGLLAFNILCKKLR